MSQSDDELQAEVEKLRKSLAYARDARIAVSEKVAKRRIERGRLLGALRDVLSAVEVKEECGVVVYDLLLSGERYRALRDLLTELEGR